MKKAKLFLFDSFDVNKNDLNNILEQIIPDNNTIIGNLYEQIKNSSTIQTILKSISNYNINLNNLNEAEYNLILDIVNKNKNNITKKIISKKYK